MESRWNSWIKNSGNLLIRQLIELGLQIFDRELMTSSHRKFNKRFRITQRYLPFFS